MSRRYADIGSGGGHVTDLLSSYIDDALGRDDREQVRAHLDTCAECRTDYTELRATAQMLRSVPVVVPPRAFTLTEEMAAQAQPRRRSLLDLLLTPRNAPRFAMGSVLSFALLLFMFAGSTLLGSQVNNTFSRIGSGLSDGGSSAASLPAPQSTPEIMASAAEATPTTGSAALPFEASPAAGWAADATTGTAGGATSQDTVAAAPPAAEDPFAFQTETTPVKQPASEGTSGYMKLNSDSGVSTSQGPGLSLRLPIFEISLVVLGILMAGAAMASNRR
jgi:anti-sigma factor RsiW